MEQKILQYSHLQIIYQNEDIIIYHAVDEKKQQSVILKVLRKSHPPMADVARLVHTYEILKSLNIPGIVKAIGLEKVDKKPVLVLEDFKGLSLNTYLKKHTLDIRTFLNIAISLANTLGDIHNHQIIHKDIKPENIIINPDTQEVRITDFGISTRLSRENPKLHNRHVLEGTLNYVSPEQTGRMNRDIDYRTDIYSLGITFYEMITGKLPFQSQDSLELIHFHLARTPTPPDEIDPKIPKAISDIIMKCLAKIPEDRYHSSYGLKNDLEECLHQLDTKNAITTITIGQKDVWDVFRIPQTLYGRDIEICTLLEAFERICVGKSECIMISGYAGVGKTSLVNEVQKPIVKQRGYFVSGKFDQLKRDVPYSGLTQALTDLINQALTESETDLAILKHKLLGALHNSGQVLIDLIPELELIIGKQPPVISLGARENQNRLKMLFKSFIHTFSKKEHPLVIFLDDLQWAGNATLLLFKELLTDPSIQHLLFIATYRDQEVSPSDPLMITLNDIKKEQGTVQELTLTPLTLDDIKRFTVDTVHTSMAKAAPLAQVLFQKSGGNPFYLIQFIKKLHKDNLLYFDSHSKEWDWDLAKIQQLEIAENVIELLAKKIQQLPPTTQNIVSKAAAIGLRFDLRLLALESNLSLSTTLRILWKAVTEEVLQPISETYHLIETKELENENADKLTDTGIYFEFIHDRVQQVAYSLLSAEEKAQIHYRIGKILLQQRYRDQFEDNIFDVISHMNQALSLIQSEEERLQIAKMNLRASQKAKNAAAYTTAYDFINIAQKLLPADCWHSQYQLSYDVYMELTECSYLTQRFDDIDYLSRIILNNAKTNLEKGNLYIIKIIYYTNIAQTKKAIEEGLECLALFGINFSQQPNKIQVLMEILRVKWKLWHKPIETLEHLPEMTDPEMKFLMKVLVNLCTPAFIIDKNLLCLFTMKMMTIQLEYGVSDDSYFVYIAYATVLIIVFRDYETAFKMGELGCKVADRYNNNTSRSRAYFIHSTVLHHWKKHLKTNEKLMNTVYTSGMEAGEVMYVSFMSAFWGFLEGTFFINLDQALKNLRRYKNTIFSIKSKQPIHAFQFKEALLLAFKNYDYKGGRIHTPDFDEDEFFKIMQNDLELQVAFQAYTATRMAIDYILEDYKGAQFVFEASKNTRKSAISLTQERDISFYEALTLASTCHEASFFQRLKSLRAIGRIKKLFKLWTQVCPENNAHRYETICAEIARVNGNIDEALKLYDIAINNAHKNQFYIEEGMISEMAGREYLKQGKRFIAKAYIDHAYDCFTHSDALAKVRHLETKYGDILQEKQLRRIQAMSTAKASQVSTITPVRTVTSVSKDSSLDMATLLQAATVLTGEIHLENLLKHMMKIVIESAGADRAFFIREVNGRWLLFAENDLTKSSAKVLQAVPYEHDTDLYSIIVIQYVIRTRQTVVLNDATHIGMFTEDPYIIKNKPKSVLCFPISHQGKLTSILYIENTSTTDAFTPSRLDVLQLLSGQIDTSIENATLYSNLEAATENLKAFNTKLEDYNRNLETKVEERTQELQQKNIQLKETLNSLKEMQKQVIQQEKLAALGSLTRGIAHEIKNPLNFINNFSSLSNELLEDLSKLIPSTQDITKDQEIENIIKHLKLNLEKIHSHSTRVDGIVVSMLKYSKETKGEKEPANLNTLLKQYLSISKKNFDEKHPGSNVELETHYDPNLRSTDVISQDIGRGLMNILDNAYYAATEKSSQAGSDPPKVSISSRQLEDAVEILIRDNGPGIPKKDRERLFHPFFTTKPTGTGTGLGLSIAYDIVVQEHAGEIKVNTEEGKFTEFIIHLPNKPEKHGSEVEDKKPQDESQNPQEAL